MFRYAFTTFLITLLSLSVVPFTASAHTDNEDIVNSFSCEIEERDNPSGAEANWWWCYDETQFVDLRETKNGAFSLSLKLDVFDESGETLVVSCSGETSTKDVSALTGTPAERLNDACESTGGACDGDQFDCHVDDVNAEEVFCRDGNETCLEDNHENCDEVAEERFDEGNEESIVWTGDIKAIHSGRGGSPSGNASSSGGGGGLQHHKAIFEDCPET